MYQNIVSKEALINVLRGQIEQKEGTFQMKINSAFSYTQDGR